MSFSDSYNTISNFTSKVIGNIVEHFKYRKKHYQSRSEPLDKHELTDFIKENFESGFIDGQIGFFEDLNTVGVNYKEITEILALGMYEYEEDVIEEIKKELVNKTFKGEFPQAPDFDINKSYYTFYQFSINYSPKAILMGYYSPLGYHHDMGFNWAKVVDSPFYNEVNVKNSYIEFSLK